MNRFGRRDRAGGALPPPPPSRPAPVEPSRGTSAPPGVDRPRQAAPTPAIGNQGTQAPYPSSQGPSQIETRRWRELQRIKGLNPGAAVFGWLVSIGISVLLTALIAAGGTAIGLQQGSVADLSGSAATLTLAGGVILFLILLLAYYAGGYVAGRLSRFSGGVQGFGVWVLSAVVTTVLAVAGVVAGSQYNVLGQLRLPSIPVKGQSLVNGGVVALCLIGVGTLLAAVLGGMVGNRYHAKVDRALERAGPGARY